jgi:hypothetical protein
VFSYNVQDGDNTSDLQVQSLSLNAGTIKDPGGQDAGLGRAATDLHLVVDTAAPTVSVTASATALLAGQTSTVTFTFSEAVTGFALSDTTVSGRHVEQTSSMSASTPRTRTSTPRPSRLT